MDTIFYVFGVEGGEGKRGKKLPWGGSSKANSMQDFRKVLGKSTTKAQL